MFISHFVSSLFVCVVFFFSKSAVLWLLARRMLSSTASCSQAKNHINLLLSLQSSCHWSKFCHCVSMAICILRSCYLCHCFCLYFKFTTNPKYPSANRCLRLYSACLCRMSLFLFNVVQKIWCKLFKNLLLSFSQIWLEVCSQIWSEFFTNLIGGFSKKFELVRTTSSGGSTLPCSLFSLSINLIFQMYLAFHICVADLSH